MYPDKFNGFDLKELTLWRTKILGDKQRAEAQAMDAKAAFARVEREIKKRE